MRFSFMLPGGPAPAFPPACGPGPDQASAAAQVRTRDTGGLGTLPAEMLLKIAGSLDACDFASLSRVDRRSHAVLDGSPQQAALEKAHVRRIGRGIASATTHDDMCLWAGRAMNYLLRPGAGSLPMDVELANLVCESLGESFMRAGNAEHRQAAELFAQRLSVLSAAMKINHVPVPAPVHSTLHKAWCHLAQFAVVSCEGNDGQQMIRRLENHLPTGGSPEDAALCRKKLGTLSRLLMARSREQHHTPGMLAGFTARFTDRTMRDIH